MAEKGGKGYSQPLKSTASLKGKDDSSAKSKSGRKVQFEFEGNWGKWGKGGKANGGKSPMTKGPPPLELRIEQELPENAKCLMDCEAAQILQGIQEQMVMLSDDPTIKIPISFDKGLHYARSSNHYSSPLSVRQVLETLKKQGVTEGEMCMIANTCPESIEEVFALIPSLKGKKSKLREPLKEALGELAKLKHST